MDNLYLTRLSSDAFPNAQGMCLGVQLALLIDLVEVRNNDCVWYGADLEANQKLIQAEENSLTPTLIGGHNEMKSLAISVDQFFRGVFLCVPRRDSNNILELQFATEDPPFRSISPACLEIRTVDTSYFEIYSSNVNLIDVVSETFKANVESGSVIKPD